MRAGASWIAALVAAGAAPGCGLGSWTWQDVTAQSSGAPGDPRWIDEAALRTSLELGADHLVAQQKPNGLFRYELDVVKNVENRDDNMVRQVGAFWATALLLEHPQARLDPARRARVEGAFQRMRRWIERRTHPLPGATAATYVDLDGEVPTGAMALIALAYLERVRGGHAEYAEPMRGLLAFVVAARGRDGTFREKWRPAKRAFAERANPYADGEALLALAKNRTVLGDRTHDDVLDAAVGRLRARWYGSRETDERKGFYQWGTMAFWWYAQSHPDQARALQEVILKYADWMVLEHKTLTRTRNTSYAVEGLATAFAAARLRRDSVRTRGLRFAILKTHARVISAQLGHPLNRHNPFVQQIPRARRRSARLLGGFLNGHDDPSLRIDVTQHAMHSILLTLEHGVLSAH